MFWLCDGDTVRNVCLWKQTQDVKEQQSAARESIKDGKRESEGDGDRAFGERILAYFERETRTFHEDSVTAVPVRDTEGKVCGILAAEGARNISGGNTSETAMLKLSLIHIFLHLRHRAHIIKEYHNVKTTKRRRTADG